MSEVALEGREVRARSPEGREARAPLGEVLDALAPRRPDSRGWVLPDGTKALVPVPDGVVLVHQTPPRVYALRWIAVRSQARFGPGARYRSVRLALPYLVVLAVYGLDKRGRLQLSNANECFFLDRSLDAAGGLTAELCYPALLNCSRFDPPGQRPLSWICSQNLDRAAFEAEPDEGRRAVLALRALLHHLLESGFNESSDHHEASSWFSETVRAAIDPRLASVEAWQAATREDPLFVLDVPWLRSGHTLAQVCERIAARVPAARRSPACAADVARIVFQRAEARAAKEARPCPPLETPSLPF